MPPRAKKSYRKKIGHKKGGRLAGHYKLKGGKKGGCYGTGLADLHRKAVEFLNSEKGKDILGKAAGYTKEYAPKVVKVAKNYRAKYGRPPK